MDNRLKYNVWEKLIWVTTKYIFRSMFFIKGSIKVIKLSEPLLKKQLTINLMQKLLHFIQHILLAVPWIQKSPSPWPFQRQELDKKAQKVTPHFLILRIKNPKQTKTIKSTSLKKFTMALLDFGIPITQYGSYYPTNGENKQWWPS